MSTISSFQSIEIKHDVYRGKDCMKKFCVILRDHPLELINFKKQKMLLKNLFTKEQQKSYQHSKICYICKEKIKDKHAKDRKSGKVRDHCHYAGEYRDAAYSICN